MVFLKHLLMYSANGDNDCHGKPHQIGHCGFLDRARDDIVSNLPQSAMIQFQKLSLNICLWFG